MALLPDRHEFQQDISFFCNDVVSRGLLLIAGSSGSGVALDQTQAVAAVPGASVSGVKPLGVLMNDMVNVDLTRYHLNFYKDEMPVGGKCCLLKKGWVCTDQIASGITPVGGDTAYIAPFGQFTNATGLGAKVGGFLSSKDEKGFAKVEVNLP